MSEDGFFSRWSRRKRGDEGAQAKEPVAEAPRDEAAVPPPQPSPGGGGSEEPAPSLEDAQALTPESDFRRFVSADVPPDVKNTALKKLFADPHFNVQDGMDVYIDDYSKPDPIPPEMLRKLVSAKFLGLFDEKDEEDDEDEKQEKVGREVADVPAVQSVAHSPEAEQAVPPTPHHADPDLRLQQDHAPGPAGPGQGSQ